jgi:hypothetical protein
VIRGAAALAVFTAVLVGADSFHEPIAVASPEFPNYCSNEAPYPPPYTMPGTVCTSYGYGYPGRWETPSTPIGPTWPTGPGSAACSSYHPASYCGPVHNPFQ